MENYSGSARVLELDKVLSLLSAETALSDAAEAALRIEPSFDRRTVARLLSETDAAYKLMAGWGAPSFGGAENPSGIFARAKAGGVLLPAELLSAAGTLRVIRTVAEWRKNNGGAEGAPLDFYFENLVPNKFFEDKIASSIKSEDELYDSASTALFDIRRKISSCETKIRTKLEGIIRGPSAKYLMETIITRRDGRFVVPVKVEYKNEIKGLVHDASASGATLFVEPLSVVEINNEIRVLHSKESAEIERILTELSAMAAEISDSAERSYKALCELNLIFAKARLGYRQKAVVPKLNDGRFILLKNARHPLLPEKDAVPITVELGREYDSLIITGPNTGGKTVALKTMGLLTLMAACGLMIPADDGSLVFVFDRVLADIGDEQSIEQSLSTFSAHLSNIVKIISEATAQSLVLIDELGSGTDPIEGAALALAILERLRSIGCRISATTHYPELKAFALETKGVENAACEFDIATLRPTYRLLIGVPGKSNAFAISARLGLEDEIIENAKSHVNHENRRMEDVIASLDRARAEAEREKTEVNRLRSELASARGSIKRRLDEIEKQKEAALNDARERAARIVDSARAESNRLITELETLKRGFSAENADARLRSAKAAQKSGLSKAGDAADPVDQKSNSSYVLPRPLREGDCVLIFDINRQAVVLSVEGDGKTALVQSGAIKTRVPVENLRLQDEVKTPEQKRVRRAGGAGEKTIGRSASNEVDLRGMAADEAILSLDKYIDDALLSGLPAITVIHGKGTGVLRRAVREHLRSHKSVSSFRSGVYGEGEDGVTIVEIGG